MQNQTCGKRRVNIRYSSEFEEYRVPSPDGREAGAYYTNDKQDAIGTALHMYRGIACHITFRGRVVA
jgi:hypothetical protein